MLIEPVQSLECAVTEVAFISTTIEGTLVGGIGDTSAKRSCPSNPMIDRNLWNNAKPMACVGDLVAGYLVAPRFNVLSNGRWSFEMIIAERALVSPAPVSGG